MNKVRMVTANLIVPILLVGLWTVAGKSKDEHRPQNAPNTRSASQPQAQSGSQTNAQGMSTEEKLTRDVYARLMRYQSAAIDEKAAASGNEAKPTDFLTFELRSFKSGPVSEISQHPLSELVTERGGEVVNVNAVRLSRLGGPSHAYYEAAWSAATPATQQNEHADESQRFASFNRYISYQVNVHLNGQNRTYRALALYQVNEAGSDSKTRSAPTRAEILDNITVDMNAVYRDESPRARAPWSKYVKTSLYRAIAKSIKTKVDAGQPLRSIDDTIGYLPGDEVDGSFADYQMAIEPIDPGDGGGGGGGGGGDPNACFSPKVHMSAAKSIKDGETAEFSVTTENGTPTAYAWSFSAPSGSGNNPHVTFTNGTTDTVTTDGHWFANPNQECGASFDAVYTIKCTVSFGNTTKSAQTTLTVNAFWDPGGTTAPPVISGGVATSFDANRGLWYVSGSGTAVRGAPAVNILIPAASQFRTKAETHENRHAYQWTTGLNVDLLQIADLMTHLSPLTDASSAGLQTKINNEFIAWYNAQVAIANNRRNAAEKDAYAVSDPIAPKYLYQNCGRFN